ncbi:hypothetical protein MKW98_010511 [Papaver atlanticum]|uniref:KIB1-4 beta-propeller domain-containing protein n=1 Tax=Papaver atlanticum TaxID=357466 RepID=A0AAD4S908_9MAGN|nr:hypothetical protein MKW98_010511 [Papaver atlanticum]
MCWNGIYLKIEIQRGSDIDHEKTLAVSKFRVCLDGISTESVSGGLAYCFKQYFVESFGEVFLIYISSISRGIYQNYVSQIVVSKLDFSSMAWVDVKSLDDHVFFLSRRTQLFCLASDLGFSKGCVYYTLHGEMSLYRYDLEDQSISLSLPCPDLRTPWFLLHWLMITTPPRIDDRRTADCNLRKVEHMDEVVKVMET